MYKMRYNIYNGEVGNAKLEISFDENLETEPIVIDLSGDLENTPKLRLSRQRDLSTVRIL